jgi:hypothetical protein
LPRWAAFGFANGEQREWRVAAKEIWGPAKRGERAQRGNFVADGTCLEEMPQASEGSEAATPNDDQKAGR